MIQPVFINTTLNSTVIFTCETIITDELTFRNQSCDADVTTKGFTETTSGIYWRYSKRRTESNSL